VAFWSAPVCVGVRAVLYSPARQLMPCRHGKLRPTCPCPGAGPLISLPSHAGEGWRCRRDKQYISAVGRGGAGFWDPEGLLDAESRSGSGRCSLAPWL